MTFNIAPSEEDIKETEDWILKTRDEFATASDPVQFINLTADSRYNSFFVPLNDIPANLRDFIKKEDKNEIFGPYEEDGSFKIARLIEAADRPDSVHARHILLSPNQIRNITKTKEAADSLLSL